MLFEPDVPEGFTYRERFITEAEEAALARDIAALEFDTFEMRGVVAKRRVAFFGRSYGEGPARPMPSFLLPLRARVAEWAGVGDAMFSMALINEYRPGAPIGWHRDAPQYEMVAGVSLLAQCRMRFRPYVAPRVLAAPAARVRRRATHQVVLAPRSGYLMSGQARSEYEHSIPPVELFRYSITFRTLRADVVGEPSLRS